MAVYITSLHYYFLICSWAHFSQWQSPCSAQRWTSLGSSSPLRFPSHLPGQCSILSYLLLEERDLHAGLIPQLQRDPQIHLHPLLHQAFQRCHGLTLPLRDGNLRSAQATALPPPLFAISALSTTGDPGEFHRDEMRESTMGRGHSRAAGSWADIMRTSGGTGCSF